MVLIGVSVAVVVGAIVAMALQWISSWTGVVILLLIAACIHVVHRVGTFLMIDDGNLKFGCFPRPQDAVPLGRIKSVRIEKLPAHQRVTRPWGSLTDPNDEKVSVFDANQSTHAIALALKDGRTVKVGVGENMPGAEDFINVVRKKHRGIRG